MNLKISKEAAKWYKEELDIEDKAQLRFFVRYGGVGGKIPGFSLGLKLDKPQAIYASTEVDNITFFIEDADAWYFENSDLEVSLDDKRNEPIMEYV
ncbi:HesB/YadR/YfhF family protein [Oceanobacillus sp. FSL K6-2867]|uniref:HesB/YadR/YfhF family protein n=1 Tax=Oceanobacillus sp. FSL K6-2867 TaxID=2954748 RepID=UPI0030DB143E